MKVKIIAFIILAIIQLAVPVNMIIQSEKALTLGDEFKIKVIPIDPYDIFRGRYLTLRTAGLARHDLPEEEQQK
ncbi:MAG: GDYXXLXY domain-containing protein, partial [Spirochaetes bacterium]|nr:GDYXXLXY domain-containing protein [Spirochaetota bacterium]